MPATANRTDMEEQLREMKRQRTSLARQVGEQNYSKQQFTAINEQINTLEYSLREQYGYGLIDAKNLEDRDLEQREEETGEEFLERLMNEDPFGSPATNSKRKACPTIEEGDEEEEEGDEKVTGSNKTVKDTPAARSSKSGTQSGTKRAENGSKLTGSAKKRQRTAGLTSGLDVVLEVNDSKNEYQIPCDDEISCDSASESISESEEAFEMSPVPSQPPAPFSSPPSSPPSPSPPNESVSESQEQFEENVSDTSSEFHMTPRNPHLTGYDLVMDKSQCDFSTCAEPASPKNLRWWSESPRNPGMTGFDLLMNEPEHGQVGVRSAKPSRSPARPKAKFENGLAAVLMATPMPNSTSIAPFSAPVRRPLMTPLSAPAGSATADPRQSEGNFFSRIWGKLRGRSTTTRGAPPKLEPLIAQVAEEDEEEEEVEA